MVTTFFFISLFRSFIALLLLGVFVSHSGELTRFLHRLGFLYCFLFICYDLSGVVFRVGDCESLNLLEIRQEDSLLFRYFSIFATAIVAIFFFGVAERFFLSKRGSLEFSLLVFFLHFGGLFALRLHTLRDLLLALERVTLASYVLVTYERQNRYSTYAGVQYFLVGSLPSVRLILSFGIFYLQGGSLALQDLDLLFGSFSSTTNVFGEALSEQAYLATEVLYSNLGQAVVVDEIFTEGAFSSIFSFNEVENLIAEVHPLTALSIRGLFFLLFNLLFKATAAPFHVWAPSVYGNAPIASVTLLSIYSKARVFFFLYKLLNTFLHSFSYIIFIFFRFCSVFSILFGRFGAFVEKRTKRFFVFSSRGHVGFRLVGLSLFTLQGASATFHYLAVYVLSSFLRWFLLLTRGRDKAYLSHFSSLKHTDPVLALIFAFLIFSRSGIPPLGGFFVKLDVLSALLENSHFFINYVLFIFTVGSFFYYLRLIKIRFFTEEESVRVSNTVSAQNVFDSEKPRYEGRVWLRVLLIQILGFYLIIVQKPLIAAQFEILASQF